MVKKKLIYVCSPLKGDIEGNIAKAKEYCKSVIIMGHIPLAPHIAFYGVFNDEVPLEREMALTFGLEIMKRCDEVWVFGNRISEGMAGEIYTAERMHMPVRWNSNDYQTPEFDQKKWGMR